MFLASSSEALSSFLVFLAPLRKRVSFIGKKDEKER
jgi:hypothetical protein